MRPSLKRMRPAGVPVPADVSVSVPVRRAFSMTCTASKILTTERSPAKVMGRAEARGALLEALADHDDALLEKVLEDSDLEPAEIYGPLHDSEASGAVVSVLLGAAEHNNGVQRLWKALRHDVPQAAETAARRGIAPDGAPLAQVFRTLHAGHAGRLSFVRLWRGPLREGVALDGHRPGGIHRFIGGEAQKVPQAEAGDLVALGRLESVGTGTTLGGPTLPFPAPPPPVYALTIAPEDRKDEVRLSTALQRLAEEDPALTVSQDPESGATVLAGQGEIHLRTALDRLAAAGVKLRTGRAPFAAYAAALRREPDGWRLELDGPIGVAPSLAAAVPQLEAAVADGLGDAPMDALGAQARMRVVRSSTA